jgi:hypothetical protein
MPSAPPFTSATSPFTKRADRKPPSRQRSRLALAGREAPAAPLGARGRARLAVLAVDVVSTIPVRVAFRGASSPLLPDPAAGAVCAENLRRAVPQSQISNLDHVLDSHLRSLCPQTHPRPAGEGRAADRAGNTEEARHGSRPDSPNFTLAAIWCELRRTRVAVGDAVGGQLRLGGPERVLPELAHVVRRRGPRHP